MQPSNNVNREKANHEDGSGIVEQFSGVETSVPSSPALAGRSSSQAAHQRLVFTDPIAFRYLEEDPSTTALERRRRLEGYELYVVEQWACSRVHPTFVITTYTGLSQHSVLVGVLSVPTDEATWSPRLRVYFKAVAQFHARKKETSLGTLMVTNLSGFPSALTVIPVPGGDVKKHREDFIVNENLKRLGCSGRAGLSLSTPVGATQAKFNQLYHISDRIPLYGAVIELVKLCQVALMLFAKLAPEYADGLLCDVTERAVNDWWTEIGSDFFNVEPSDGILGPTTVAALLGMLMGARNRLNTFGAPVAKDVFDLPSTKRGIAYFQKSQKLSRTRRLDRSTLDRLHRATAKAASGEGWTVPRAVKSTVVELSGKGGEMVMGMVGGRDKAGIAEVETLDIDTLANLASGERAKWLWHGKPRKTNEGDIFGNLGRGHGIEFVKDDHGGYLWSGKRRDSLTDDSSVRQGTYGQVYLHPASGSQTSLDLGEKDLALRRTVLKSVTGRVNDARSGIGRIKDAVGIPSLRTNHQKLVREGDMMTDNDDVKEQYHTEDGTEISLPQPSVSRSHLAPLDLAYEYTSEIPRSQTGGQHEPGQSDARDLEFLSHRRVKSRDSSKSSSYHVVEQVNLAEVEDTEDVAGFEGPDDPFTEIRHSPRDVTTQNHVDTAYRYTDMGSRDTQNQNHRVRPSLLSLQIVHSHSPSPHQTISGSRWDQWPRHLSFSAVEDILVGENIPLGDDDTVRHEPAETLSWEASSNCRRKWMGERLLDLKEHDAFCVETRVGDIEQLDMQAGQDQEDLDSMYHQKLEEYHALSVASTDLLGEEKTSLNDAKKEVEVLCAKLEYELSGLQSKVEDMEDGVSEYERQVIEIEGRAKDLVDEERVKITWLSWFLSYLTGNSKPVE